MTTAARQGDAQALALLASEARWLGIGIANLLHLYSPERVDPRRRRRWRPRSDAGRDRPHDPGAAMPAYRDVPVVAARLGGNAGLVGAASLILWEGEPGAPLAMVLDDNDCGATADAREASHG